MTHPAQMKWTHPAKLIALWFGAGAMRHAPGTAGSLAALPFAYVIQKAGGNFALLIASLLMFFIGWWASHVYMKHVYGGDMQRDPKEIVVDEVVGQWLLLSILLPSAMSYLIGFALFRFFDVLKPWPISTFDRRIKGSFGVMIDDVLAAFYPCALALLGLMLLNRAGIAPSLQPVIRILNYGAFS